MATDNYWYLRVKNQVDILADYILTDWSDANELTIGETRTVTLHFNTVNDLVVSSSYTVASGTVEQYDTVTIKDGATLTIESNAELYTNTVDVQSGGTLDQQTDSKLVEYGGLVDRLLELGKWAGGYTTVEMLDSTQKYREQYNTSRANIDSLVIGLEPSQSLKDRDVRGVWGLLSTDTDNRPRALSDVQYNIELKILGWYSEYSTHSDVATNLEI